MKKPKDVTEPVGSSQLLSPRASGDGGSAEPLSPDKGRRREDMEAIAWGNTLIRPLALFMREKGIGVLHLEDTGKTFKYELIPSGSPTSERNDGNELGK